MNTAEEFSDLMARRSEHFDAEIIRDMHPCDSLIGTVSTGRFRAELQPEWWICREVVRKISEHLGFRDSKPVKTATAHGFDKFNQIWPDIQGSWMATQEHAVGRTCDLPFAVHT